MNKYKDIISEAIEGFLSDDYLRESTVREAMKYAISNGGKRVRPTLLLALLEDFTGSYEKGIRAACALEMIHTYSLIHDDLPAMDNDDYRRNQLTVHKKFREDIAILAGDALLTQAFVLASESPCAAEVTAELARAAGANGMIYGQELDLKYENAEISLDDLLTVHRHKTGDLLSAPLVIAAILSDRREYIDVLREAGYAIGLAFQIQDDVLDVTKNLKKEGEESSDEKNHKNTYLTFCSISQAQSDTDELYERVITTLNSLPLKSHHTAEFLSSLINRQI